MAKRLLSLVVLAAIFAGCGNPWMKRITASLYDKPEVPVQTVFAKAITAFDITSPVSVMGFIDEAAKTIAVTVPYDTAITSLTPTIKHTGASVSPASDTAQDFTNPVTYTVTAADGSTETYTVTVTAVTTLNDIMAIGAYLGEPVTEPVLLAVSIHLGGSGWTDLLDAIALAGKTVKLDLSACTMSGTVFDPDEGYSAGKNKIVSLVLPDAAENIPYSSDSTFKGFSALTSVKGVRINIIGGYAFRNCPALTEVSFLMATEIGGYAFTNCSALTELTEVSFPMVQTIGDLAFYGCTGLTAIDLPATEIGTTAFRGCNHLETVNLPAAVTVGASAFEECTALRTVSLPAATTINSFAFEDCTGLESLTLPATPPPSFSHVFTSSGLGAGAGTTLTIHVPTAAAVLAYVSAWGVSNPSTGDTGRYGNNHKEILIVGDLP